MNKSCRVNRPRIFCLSSPRRRLYEESRRMEIYISRDGVQHGPYSVEEVNDRLASGEVSLDDLAWHEGAAEWLPLRQLFDVEIVEEPAVEEDSSYEPVPEPESVRQPEPEPAPELKQEPEPVPDPIHHPEPEPQPEKKPEPVPMPEPPPARTRSSGPPSWVPPRRDGL